MLKSVESNPESQRPTTRSRSHRKPRWGECLALCQSDNYGKWALGSLQETLSGRISLISDQSQCGFTCVQFSTHFLETGGKRINLLLLARDGRFLFCDSSV